MKTKITSKTLFIFDEPTSGLHYSDISNFMKSIQKLIHIGNSVIIIEHNTDLIKQADWLIDLGPEGGEGVEYAFLVIQKILLQKRK